MKEKRSVFEKLRLCIFFGFFIVLVAVESVFFKAWSWMARAIFLHGR
jgi:hypothetical protein